MSEVTTEIEIIPLEKVIENKLVTNNVTEQVLTALKDKYGELKLASLDDKESYLELKAAAKDCAKVRNLAVKICKEGREDALKVQKLWVAKEKEVVARVEEVEGPLDEEIAKFDAETQRKENEEKQRKEEAYINRQATLTKMGAKYEGGSFVLGEASFEAELVKGASDDIWNEAVVPKFMAEYEKIEAVRIEAERKRAEEQAEIERQKQELAKQQEEFRQQQAESQRQREESDRLEREKKQAEELRQAKERTELQRKRFSAIFPYSPIAGDIDMQNLWTLDDADFAAITTSAKADFEQRQAEKERLAEEKRLADIEFAKQEAVKQAEIQRKQEEAERAEKLAQASDKEKYADFIAKIAAIQVPNVASGQYRKKVNTIKDHLEKIFAL